MQAYEVEDIRNSKQDQGRVFNKSARLRDALEGTGMSLYIIKRLMEIAVAKLKWRAVMTKAVILNFISENNFKITV